MFLSSLFPQENKVFPDRLLIPIYYESFSKLVFDLAKLEYLSSTGLRVFLMMAKRLGSENLLVDNANTLIREIFETTGFSEVITIR